MSMDDNNTKAKGRTRTFVAEDADRAREIVAMLTAKERAASTLNAGELVRALAKNLREAKKRGYTYDEIATQLQARGINISAATIKRHLAKRS